MIFADLFSDLNRNSSITIIIICYKWVFNILKSKTWKNLLHLLNKDKNKNTNNNFLMEKK